MISLRTNIASQGAISRLGQHTRELSSAFNHLSSGLRITKPSDDAAGLAIGEGIKADARVFNQGVRNLNDGISLLNTAEGALGQLSSIVIRQTELAEQAANGVYTQSQRLALHKEANALVNEFNRIVRSTQFSGNAIIDGVNDSVTVQGGYGSNESTLLSLSQGLGLAAGSGSYTASLVASSGYSTNADFADVDGDGDLDMMSNNTNDQIEIKINNGSGGFSNGAVLMPPAINGRAVFGDIDQDGKVDIVNTSQSGGSARVFKGNGDGTFVAGVDYAVGAGNPYGLRMADLNGDGFLDLAVTLVVAGKVSVLLANSNGTFKAPQSYEASGMFGYDLTINDFNNDGILDIASSNTNTGLLAVLLGNGGGTFRAPITNLSSGGAADITAADFNGDGILDIVTADNAGAGVRVFLGNGDGSLKAGTAWTAGASNSTVAAGDLNGDGYADLVFGGGGAAWVLRGNGDGSFLAGVSTTAGFHDISIIADLNGDGVVDLAGSNGNNGVRIMTGIADSTGRRSNFEYTLDLITTPSAREALTKLASMRNRIASEQGRVGALQSRLASSVNTIRNRSENYTVAQSQIFDVDVATEAAKMVAKQIAQKASVAVLHQANLQPEIALKLLDIKS